MEPSQRTIECERLILREPRGGRVRAELAAEPAGPVTLDLFAPNGDCAATVRVNADGEAEVVLGNPNGGRALVLTLRTIDLWAGGNVVASLYTAAGE